MAGKRTSAAVVKRTPAADSIAQLKCSIEASGLTDEAVGWVWKPERLLNEFEEQLAPVADYFEQLPATGTPDQLADMERWGKKVTDILRLIRLIRSTRAEGEHEIAQALFYLLGSGLTSAGFAKATVGEEPTYVDELSAKLEEKTAALAMLAAATRNMTRPATNGIVAMKPLRKEYIERIDCELGARKGKKNTRSEKIQSLIRTRIQATPLKERLPYMKKVPGLGLIQKYIK